MAEQQEDRTPIPMSCYAVVIVRKKEEIEGEREGERKEITKFLAVQEAPRHGCTWYLPAGRVNKGESFVKAALREAKEETGIDIEIEGILRIEHSPYAIGTRLRVIFVAKPVDPNAPLKSVPDYESTGARWVTVEELKTLNLRAKEVVTLFSRHVDTNPPVYPLSILTLEGAKFS